MEGIAALNNFASQSVTVTDERPADVRWNLFPDFNFSDTQFDLSVDGVPGSVAGQTSITLSMPDDVVEIINYPTADLTMVWDIECAVPAWLMTYIR